MQNRERKSAGLGDAALPRAGEDGARVQPAGEDGARVLRADEDAALFRAGENEDAALFRAAVDDVAPLADARRARIAASRKPALPLQSRRDERQALVDSLSVDADWAVDCESGDALMFLRPGLSRQVLKRLRQGYWVVQDQLDLHGLTSADARAPLVDFLNASLRAGSRCVRVVHGKGLRSANGEPVLKNRVRAWLAQRDEVLAFVEAPAAGGGSGAVVVLLKGAR